MAVITIVITALGSVCISVWGQELTADLPYNNALSYLEETDLERAYSFCKLTIKNFPNSEYAKKAKTLQVIISSSAAWHKKKMMEIYQNGFEKAILDDEKNDFFRSYGTMIRQSKMQLHWVRSVGILTEMEVTMDGVRSAIHGNVVQV